MKLVVSAAMIGMSSLLAVVTSAVRAEDFPQVVDAAPLSPADERQKFHLPPGFEIELVTSEPHIRKPMNMAFDARGRLFVTHSVEYPYAAKKGGRDAVTMLEDRDHDGQFETATRVAEGLNIPIGILPLRDELIVFSIPNIYRLRDADGDGQFEEKEVLYGPFGYDDTHGMNNSFTRWIDGWIYACHGFRNTSTISGTDAHKVSMNSGNTYRYRADGSRIEQFTFGQVNPFGLCFDPMGNLYSADCHSLPMYQLLRGGYYPSFGKPHDGLDFAPTVITHSHGSTGIAGIVYYAADQFPENYQGTVFIGNPITYRINHDRMEPHGSSYRGIEQKDFLVCDDPWFRAVDLKLGPDGALYVVDFYNCIIGHYEVPLEHPKRDHERGRIWRIVYRGEGKTVGACPDLTQQSLQQLWEQLSGPNLTLRTLATNEIVDRFGSTSHDALRDMLVKSSSPLQRAHGVWVVERSGGVPLDDIKTLAADPDAQVRVQVMKMLAERPEWPEEIAALARNALVDPSPHVRRAAADSVGLHPDVNNVNPLLQLWASTPADDTHLIHVTRMALRNQIAIEATMKDFAQRQLTDNVYRRLAEVALGANSEVIGDFLLAGVRTGRVEPPMLNNTVRHMGRNIRADQIGAVWEAIRNTEPLPVLAGLTLALHAGLEERSGQLPQSAMDVAPKMATTLLRDTDRNVVFLGVQLVRTLRLADVFDQVAEISASNMRDDEVRGLAMEACIAVDRDRATSQLGAVLANAGDGQASRMRAAQMLAQINTGASRQQLLTILPIAHLQLATEIASGLARSADGGDALLKAIADGKVTPQVLQQRNVRESLSQSKTRKWKERLESLTADLPPLDDKLRDLVQQRQAGFTSAKADLEIGKQVFTKNCGICHKLAGEGQKVGPELDGIGNRGLAHILEDVIDPSRNVDPAFRTTNINTTSGQLITGLLLRQEGDVLVLADSKGSLQRVAKSEIDEQKLSPLSPMPANVAEIISEPDFYHLIGYLLSQRKAP